MLSTPSRIWKRTAWRISSTPSTMVEGPTARVVLLALVAHRAGDADLEPAGADARAGHAAGVDLVAHRDAQPQLGFGRAVGAGEARLDQCLGPARGGEHLLLGRGRDQVLGGGHALEARGGRGPRSCRACRTARWRRSRDRPRPVRGQGRARPPGHGGDSVCLDQQVAAKRLGRRSRRRSSRSGSGSCPRLLSFSAD